MGANRPPNRLAAAAIAGKRRMGSGPGAYWVKAYIGLASATGLLLFAFAPGVASAKTQVRVVPYHAGKGAPRATGCPSPEEALMLIARRETGFTVRKLICSGDGKASATAVDDAFDETFVLVERSEGKSPRALDEYLVVYRMSDRMIPRAHVKLSEGVGPRMRWRYDYKVNRPDAGGLEIVLTRQGGDPSTTDDATKLVRVTAK